ncbi:MAG: hypothetical protein WAK91_12415, partial [Candidatus Acidiferrales bacterium]
MKFSHEVARLLGYVRPHIARLTGGVILLAILGLSEGLIALMIIPAYDVVLNPHSSEQKLKLVTIPFVGRTIYLNSFFPQSVHFVWTVFAIALLVIFLVKAASEFLGSILVQY